jgi:cytochrome c peroxidase
MIQLLIPLAAAMLSAAPPAGTSRDSRNLVSLGARLFSATSLSKDGTVSCQSCHDPKHVFADPRPVSIGVDGNKGTRNAPSLIGIGDDQAFFWDGRRSKLEAAVLDPFTNPAELGLPSLDEVSKRILVDSQLSEAFHAVYKNQATPTPENVGAALAAYVRALDAVPGRKAGQSAAANAAEVEHGRRLFFGDAGCSECHSSDSKPERYSDGKFHHSSAEQPLKGDKLVNVANSVAAAHLEAARLGPKVLTDPDWSALGRYCVTFDPHDIGAFRTPSLINVARTSPYMHDGSVPTLIEAVDREIYYRSFSTGKPIDLSTAERLAIVSFLESLSFEPSEHAANAD